MIDLKSLVAELDTELNTKGIQDYPGAYNGLQLTNSSGKVTRVAAAVDACLPVFRKAVDSGADLLIIHHGMFWSGVQMIDGSYFEKLKLAMDHGLAVYSSHLPLDYHPSMGNDVLLAQAMGFPEGAFFGESKGLPLGWKIETEIPRETLVSRVQSAVGGSRVHLSAGGPATCRKIAVLTGGAGSEVAKIAAHGIDTLVTGEGPHHTYTLAEELGVNLLYAGHYATETFGVKALAQWIQNRHGIPWEFLDHPTGL